MFSEEPIGIGIGACCSGRPIVAAVMVAVFRMVIGNPPTGQLNQTNLNQQLTVRVGVDASVAANIRSTRAAPIGNVMLEAPSGHVILPAASEQ